MLLVMSKNIAANRITCSHILIYQHVLVCIKSYAIAGGISEYGKISLSFCLDFCLRNRYPATIFQYLLD